MGNSQTRSFGYWGEETAARYLERRGLRVVDRHYRQKWGEIDLICRDRQTWVFVEVKARSSHFQPSAVDSITLAKRKRLIRPALSYLKCKRLEGCAMRFDLVLIEAGGIQWITDAFEPHSHYTY